MKKLIIGIIGAGRIGKLHTDNILTQCQSVNIKSIADPHLDEAWTKTKPFIHFTHDPNSIINDDEIEAVLICSPTPHHASQIIASANKGKHIFCEKPIALDIANIHSALQAVEGANVKLQVGFNRRFDPNFAKIKHVVSNHDIGFPHLVRITSRDPKIPPLDFLKSSGGMLMDMTIHDFDMIQFLINSEIEEVYTMGNVLIDPIFNQYNDIDTAVINLKLANGTLGVIDNSRQAVYGYDQRVEVFGSRGSIYADNNKPTNTILSNEQGVLTDKPLYYFLERYKESYIAEMQDFFNAIMEDRPCSVSGKEGLNSMIVAKAAAQSLQENRPIKINYSG